MTLAGRKQRIQDTLREHGWDLLVCALPANVLMLCGYWPIVGTGVVCINREGEIRLLAPHDEEELARQSWAQEVSTFEPGSLDSLAPPWQRIQKPLTELITGKPPRIAFENGEVSEPASYAAMNFYNGSMRELLKAAFPHAALELADDALARLRSVKTEDEIEHLRTACQIAARAFGEGLTQLHTEMEEIDAAANFRRSLICSLSIRADGWVSCMSGANSGHAFGAFARSTHKHIQPGDLVLTHCNSYVDGYWTDITRTYVAGEPVSRSSAARQNAMYRAIRGAHDAALAAIAPAAKACEVDRAARETLARHGFGPQFKHPTGHGVGFGAIDAHALPRIHPKSQDRLETGMVFNVEPAIYFPGYGGMRHCDMVAVTDSGAELLTPFQPVEVPA